MVKHPLSQIEKEDEKTIAGRKHAARKKKAAASQSSPSEEKPIIPTAYSGTVSVTPDEELP